ncbi:hypothetical protein HUK80_06075 [Flavobacterium sp. MAH-1]|uniref:Uncharacterized protein n=1 Tax=Flavobacterium agri TaxID=2743471 RepID=A0A7Y8Y0R8_9FLAO|nr:hypothetical protein [Flavobacterium agri]NUY80456.1 hypothetical protein [Flavobacterium agri]NYA70481.1 hypothetical protein [Flavobacterium agri]
MAKVLKSNFEGFAFTGPHSDNPDAEQAEKDRGSSADDHETEIDPDEHMIRYKVQEGHCSQSEEDFWRGI